MYPQKKYCRVCGGEFFEKPLLHFSGMPKAAQYLPNKDDLTKEKGVNLTVYQCSGCGLVQLISEPVPYYQEVIRASGFSEAMKNFRIMQFRELVQKYSLQNKKIIEIGCGRGEYLSLLNLSGANAYGLEDSEESVNYCVANGLKVSKGFVKNSDDKLKDEPFDAFCILSFLEHLPDPNETLKGIYNNLADNAVGLIEVPNFDMILKNKLFSEFIGDHLFYFTKETLKITLALNGFEILEINDIWHNYIISAVIKKRQKLNLEDFYNYGERITKEISGFVACFETNKVAVWGAGHQALAIIAMSDLKGKIKYVVDSAIFKQGKYTPATHIPIVSPDLLISNPVEAIIVIAGSYSDEVVRIIQSKYDKNLRVSILRDFGLEEVLLHHELDFQQ
jgi:2-polyprenyl-3-methyl-5-hydroxy-6-metoxy-1,4-benzoquinol methylase